MSSLRTAHATASQATPATLAQRLSALRAGLRAALRALRHSNT